MWQRQRIIVSFLSPSLPHSSSHVVTLRRQCHPKTRRKRVKSIRLESFLGLCRAFMYCNLPSPVQGTRDANAERDDARYFQFIDVYSFFDWDYEGSKPSRRLVKIKQFCYWKSKSLGKPWIQHETRSGSTSAPSRIAQDGEPVAVRQNVAEGVPASTRSTRHSLSST